MRIRDILRFFPLLVIMLMLSARAERSLGFSFGAFEALHPEKGVNSVVFSPFSFEIDAAILSEALGTIERSHTVETLGALTGYENVYVPMLARYAEGAESNSVSLVSARGFVTQFTSDFAVSYRTLLQDRFGAEVCPSKPKDGAVCWFRTQMDGTMEDFSIPMNEVEDTRYSFYDLESVKVVWDEAFSELETKIDFVDVDGMRDSRKAFGGIREGVLWKNKEFSALRLDVADGVRFYAVQPADGKNIAGLLPLFREKKIDEFVSYMNAAVDPKLYRGELRVKLPVVEVTCESDLQPICDAYKFPLTGFKWVICSGVPGKVRQVLRYKLDGSGRKVALRKGTQPAEALPEAVFDRSFLFFVCHESENSIPVMGVVK